MVNENNQDLTRSSQQKLTKYSSELTKKGLNLAKNLKSKHNGTEIKQRFLTSVHVFAKDFDDTSSLSISANGTRLASYSDSFFSSDDGIIIWDLRTYEKLRVLDGSPPICISPDGNLLACFLAHDNDSQFRDFLTIYDINTGFIVKNFEAINDFFDPCYPGAK